MFENYYYGKIPNNTVSIGGYTEILHDLMLSLLSVRALSENQNGICTFPTK